MAVGRDNISRTNLGFVKDGALDDSDQASDSDFIAPYDRRHMTPANDAPEEDTQRNTFVFTNAVPQHKSLNRHLWQYLEASLHQVAELEGDVYIVTGPIFWVGGIDPFPALSTDMKASRSSYGLPPGINIKRNGSRQRLPLPDC